MEFDKHYEQNNLPSCTIPDQTMSLRTLLERFTRGLPLPSASGYGDPQYYGDDEDYMTDIRHLDLADREEILRNHKTKVYDLQERVKQEAEAERLEREKQASQKSVPPTPEVVTVAAAS